MGWAERRERNKQAMAAFLGCENREKTCAELKTFFGPRAEIYLRTYEKMRLNKDGGGWALTWSWPGFLLGFPWFFYRRMYSMGALCLLLPIVLGILFPSANGASMMGLGMFAKNIYVFSALKRIQKANELGIIGDERTEYLQRAGGVSLTAGLLAGILYAAIAAVAILGVVAKAKGIR